ncbi:MAG: hypothetical protein ACFFAE_12595 [Candidatus Hodarchaeota archaeon]
MKKSKTSILIVLLLVMCTSSSSGANEQPVDILQVTRIGSSISIVLDYDLNSTSQLDINESLAVMVVFSQDESSTIEAAMLFFHTVEEEYFLFWMLGDPFTQAQNWQIGVENEHFQIEYELLTLNFIEFQGIKDPDMEIIVLAKINSVYEVSTYTNDFRPILIQFITDLPISYEFPSIETKATSEKKSSPGFTIHSTLGVILLTLITIRFRRKLRL